MTVHRFTVMQRGERDADGYRAVCRELYDLDQSHLRWRRDMMRRGAVVLVALAMVLVAVLASRAAGNYPDSALHRWFDRLASHKGLCCSFADGESVADVDWDTRDGKYRVRLNGQWIVVPDDAVVTDPNRFGPAVVWPVFSDDGAGHRTLDFIRCFMPGAGS